MSLIFRAISKVQVDQGLVVNTSVLGHRLEVVEHFLAYIDGDLPLHLIGIRVLAPVAKLYSALMDLPSSTIIVPGLCFSGLSV